ncbi:site-specific integrase [Georgenia daeguensis]|uniref:Site-specific integrase n=1 Tax=Georgenia daeguensis TaxID=908355 RepID=A0ABP8ETL8_9MICO
MNGSVYKRCSCPSNGGQGARRVACRKDHGTWYYVLDLGPGPGADGTWRRRRQSKKGGFRTKKEAEVALAQAAASKADGTLAYDQSLTVGRYLETWLEQKVAAGLKPTTARSYRQHIDDYLVPLFGHRRLRDLGPGEVEVALSGLVQDGGKRGRPVSPSTVQRIRATLRSALASAKRKRLVATNAAQDLELPAARRPRVSPWEPDELGAFLEVAAQDSLGALFEVIAFTGLRRGEALGLRWADIDVKSRRLVVRRQVVGLPSPEPCPFCGAVHKGRQFGSPKTEGREGGVIELATRTLEALEAHGLVQDLDRAEWGTAYSDHDLVFARPNGEPLAPDAVTKAFTALAEKAGLRPVRLHDLRHGAASLMLADGVDIAVVSKVLGHSSIAITVDTYAHLLPGVGRDAAERAASRVRRPVRDHSVTTRPNMRSLKASTYGETAGQEVGPVGIEPTTRGLKVRCSAD